MRKKARPSRLKPILVHPGVGELLALHRADAVASGRPVEHVEFCERMLRDGLLEVVRTEIAKCNAHAKRGHSATPTGTSFILQVGRDNGREFIQKTSAIFLKYMGPALLLDSARLRKQLTREAALQLFSKAFETPRLSVGESFTTYYDTLEGHWSWWVRVEGHFVKIPPEKKAHCDRQVREALQSLTEPQGIPYTFHELHVQLRRPDLLH